MLVIKEMSTMRKFTKYLKVGYNYSKNRMLTNKSIKKKKMFTGPWSAYLNITYNCNCKCIHCPTEIAETAKDEKASEYLNVDEYSRLIDQLTASGCLRIGVTGGEPLLFKDKTLRILKKINEKAYSQIVTNGSHLDSDFLESYNEIGGGHITISIDGLYQKHDNIRQKPGLFEKLEYIMDRFDENRYKNIMLKSTFTLTNNNVDELIPTAEYLIRRKIPLYISLYVKDPVFFSFAENIQHKPSLLDNRKNPLWIQEEKEEALKSAIKRIVALKKKFPHLIINGNTYLLAIEDYFLRPEKAFDSPRRCYQAYRTVHVTPKGQVIACTGAVDSVRNGDLFDIWDSAKFHNIRKRQLHCRHNCMSGCVIDHSYLDLFRVIAYQTFKK